LGVGFPVFFFFFFLCETRKFVFILVLEMVLNFEARVDDEVEERRGW